MKIIIAYATNSGGTFLASEIVQKLLIEKNNEVVLKDISAISPETLSDYDLVIFASPSWDYQGTQGVPHESFLSFIQSMKGRVLKDRKFAIFGLGDSSYTYFSGAVNHLEKLVKDIQGNLIIEPLRIDGFYFNQEQNTQLLTQWAEKLKTDLSS